LKSPAVKESASLLVHPTNPGIRCFFTATTSCWAGPSDNQYGGNLTFGGKFTALHCAKRNKLICFRKRGTQMEERQEPGGGPGDGPHNDIGDGPRNDIFTR
jgi:hypothetical protein